MFGKISQYIALAALVVLASCAHKPTTYQVDVGQSGASPGGALKAGPGETVRASEKVSTGFVANGQLGEPVKVGRAMAIVEHKRPDPKTGKLRTINREVTYNVKTTAGIDFVFAQAYSTSTGANGLNYIGCSNDSVTETSASTTLSAEIAANGLTRAQGTYAHTAGQATATIAKTFTCATAPQSVQKCALFSASSSGTMTHVLGFTQRALQVGDQLAITFTITISALEDSSPYRWAANDNGWNDLFAWKQDELPAANDNGLADFLAREAA